MLQVGRSRLLDEGYTTPVTQCDAEHLPFPDNYFDCVSIAFGLRNVTHKNIALSEMQRVLRPGGCLVVLEFSKVAKPLKQIYDAYSFKLLPRIGQIIANDADSYRYLAESIRMHPGQEELKRMMEDAGLENVEYFNLTGGVVAVHRGYKF
jgi:demethylmenaquinone methyltransferase/2-methoxy-6-polyprenyl-1,4-benzoquinol methylase